MKNKKKRLKVKEENIKKQNENKKQLYNKQPRNNELLLSKEREILKNIYNKKLNKIDELSKTIDYNDMKLIISSSGTEANFSELKDPVAFLDGIRKREISNYQLKKRNINKKNFIDI